MAVEPPDTDSRNGGDRSPWQRSWVLPAVMLVLIGGIIVAAVVGVRGGSGDAAEETTTETTTTEETTIDETTTEVSPDEGSGLPSAFAVLRSQDSPIVPGTDTFTELLRLELPPSTYVVSAKVGLHNRDSALSLRAECELVPGNEDGTRPAGPDVVGADVAMLHLGPAGVAGEHGEFPLGVTQVLAAPGSVVLGCATHGHEHGAFAQYAWIRAIEVASVETRRQP